MKRKPHSTSLVMLLICIFTFWWGISVLAQHDLRATVEVTSDQNFAPALPPLSITETTNGHTYTYSGSYIPHSMCDSLSSGIQYSAAGGGHVSVLLLTSPAATACAQAAAPSDGQPFSVSVTMPKDSAPVFDGVQVNGSPVPAQLIAAN